jgi:tetratricopeptide (TPR) repeat protein
LAYFSLGKYREAVESYRKALELDPTNTAIRDSLSAAEMKLREITSQPHPNFPTAEASLTSHFILSSFFSFMLSFSFIHSSIHSFSHSRSCSQLFFVMVHQ